MVSSIFSPSNYFFFLLYIPVKHPLTSPSLRNLPPCPFPFFSEKGAPWVPLHPTLGYLVPAVQFVIYPWKEHGLLDGQPLALKPSLQDHYLGAVQPTAGLISPLLAIPQLRFFYWYSA